MTTGHGLYDFDKLLPFFSLPLGKMQRNLIRQLRLKEQEKSTMLFCVATCSRNLFDQSFEVILHTFFLRNGIMQFVYIWQQTL